MEKILSNKKFMKRIKKMYYLLEEESKVVIYTHSSQVIIDKDCGEKYHKQYTQQVS